MRIGEKGVRIGDCFVPCLLTIIVLPVIASCDRPEAKPPASLGTADSYSIAAGTTLRRTAPGVLANDQYTGKGRAVRLVTPAKYGDITLAEDGSFVYEPKYKYSGRDLFSYQIVDGDIISEPIPVQITYPNVVVILVDDLGRGDIAAINSHAAIATPNLDALAAAGMSFHQAHSSAAVCAPSRYSLLTGNHPYRGRRSSGVWKSFEPSTMIIPGQATLGDLFDESGYQTGFIGKMHMGGAFWNIAGTDYIRNPDDIDFTRSFDRGPTQFGFDYSFVLPAGLSGPPYAFFENDRLVRFDASAQRYTTFDRNEDALRHFLKIDSSWGKSADSGLIGGLIGAQGWALDNYDSRNVGRILTRKALEFMGQAIDENTALKYPQPFFLYFAPPQLHTPYTPPEYFDIAFADDSGQAPAGTPVAGADGAPRLDMIREIDLMVGAIVDFLNERGQLDNTLIIFSSDNGPTTWENTHAGVYPQGTDDGVPLRAYKGEIYEGGHRVPLLARWGDGITSQSFIAPGTHSEELLGLHDLAATFYSLLGTQRPFNQANDSKSILPILLGTRSAVTPLRDHLIIQGSPSSAADNKNYIDRAFYKHNSKGDLWKLTVVSRISDPVAEIAWGELYNLSTDPGESTDLFAHRDFEALREAMKSEYLELIIKPQTIVGFK